MSNNTYNTKQKQLIYDLLCRNKNTQFTCEELAGILKESGTPVGKTTVYRYIMKLLSEGKVRRFTDEGKTATFCFVENKEQCESHMHLKCTGCGEFIHLDCEVMNEVIGHITSEHNFKIDNSQTVIYGLCGKCGKFR